MTSDHGRSFDCDRPNSATNTALPLDPTRPSRVPFTHEPVSSILMTKQGRFLSFLLQMMVMAVVVSAFLLFVGIGVLVLIHICIVGRGLRRGFGTRSSERGNSDCRSGLSQNDLQKLPCFDYGVEGSSDCAVCLEGFQRGDRCRLLPVCKHSFHAQCVDAWLLKAPACPICRTGVDLQGLKVNGEGIVEFGQETRVLQNIEDGPVQLPGSSVVGV